MNDTRLYFPNRPALSLDRAALMGILNVTPDSFSDGGQFADVDAAVAHGVAMARAGAAIIDVGGESTRPGAKRIDAHTQTARVLPVIEALRAALDQASLEHVMISIDTTRADVAEPALDAGAAMLNDVAGGLEDEALLPLAAKRGTPITLMHMQGAPATMQQAPHYENVVQEVLDFLRQRVAAAEAAGIHRSQIIIDPGIGFGKTTEHNLTLLKHLERFVATGQSVLVGASRKRFIETVSEAGGAPTDDRLGGTCAVTARAAQAGVSIIRVHDVAPNKQAAELTAAIDRATVTPGE